MRARDRTGHIFGRLTAIESAGSDAHGQVRWRCRCACGQETVVAGFKLKQGHTRSCGCLMRETAVAIRMTHGQAARGRVSKEYRAWKAAKDRCLNPRNKGYPNWGGRDITMAPEWLNDFPAFFAHIGPAPGPELTLDRIDNERGYEPGNVRWATRSQQNANRRPRRACPA